MAQVPAAAASSIGSRIATQALSFVANLGASFLLSRLSAQDGPRLDNLDAAGGEYGVTMPRAYGSAFRLTGIFIAQADIKETKHTVGSTELNILIGAATGALEGFMLGGRSARRSARSSAGCSASPRPSSIITPTRTRWRCCCATALARRRSRASPNCGPTAS
jgi:hypothetical protein